MIHAQQNQYCTSNGDLLYIYIKFELNRMHQLGTSILLILRVHTRLKKKIENNST